MSSPLVPLKVAIVLPTIFLFVVSVTVQMVLHGRALNQLATEESAQTVRHLILAGRARLDESLVRSAALHHAITELLTCGAVSQAVNTVQCVPELLARMSVADMPVRQIGVVDRRQHTWGWRRSAGTPVAWEPLDTQGALAERQVGSLQASPGPRQHGAASPDIPKLLISAEERDLSWRATQGDVAGEHAVVVTSSSLSTLSSILRAAGAPSGGHLILIDEQGRLLAHSSAVDTGRSDATGHWQLLRLEDSAEPLERAAAHTLSGLDVGNGADFGFRFGSENFHGRVEPYRVPEGQETPAWRLVALMGESALLSDTRRIQMTGVVISVVLASVGVLLAVWIISKVTRPLLSAAKAASQSSLSDLSGLRHEDTPVRETAMLMGAISDMADRLQRSIDRLHDLAMLDEQTGLVTRRGLVEVIDWPNSRPCYLFLIAIDDFRSINNIFGYEAGDELLRTIAARLARGTPLPLKVARTGNDEFAVLYTLDPNISSWESIGYSLREQFEQVFEIGSERLSVRCSIGAMTGELSSANVDKWLRCAGVALHDAKHSPMQSMSHYSPVLEEASTRHGQLVSALRKAVTNKEFVVLYQPIFDLRTQDVEGVEALVRWNHPQHGMLAPDAFIGAAEESEVIVKIGEAVLRQICQDIREHHDRTHRWVNTHINVSSRQMLQHDFLDLLQRSLRQAGIPPRVLTVELTESMFIGHDDAKVAPVFMSLKAIGIGIAIDDFGTGYSSLSYLERLPLDCLKIDRSFVLKLVDPQGRGYAVARAVIEVGQHLGLRLVAEGVETEEQKQQLLALGCTLAQGYLFARPMPWSEIAFPVPAGATP